MASTSLTRTTGTPTLGTKVTVSCWVKINEVPAGSGSDRWLFGEWGNSSNHSYLYLRNSSQIGWYEADGSGTVASIITNRLCRDLNGWYHFMIVYDTTLSTQADRFKLYINGERQTSWGTNTNSIAQDYLPRINKASRSYYIGGSPHVTKFGGLISHYHHVDGSALDPSVFGETDSTTGEWKIKTNPSFTVGNNGFTILKDGNTITDQSSNSNDFTVASGTLTKTEDCPSNVFATMNPLFHKAGAVTFSNGNNTATAGSGSTSWTTRWGISSIGFSSGKFYAEAKISDYGSGQLYPIGIVRDENIPNINSSIGSNGWGYYTLASGGGTIIGSEDGTNLQTSLGASTTGDIIGLAVDADNNTLQFYKNGSTLGSQVTGITAGTYFIGCNAYANFGIQMNFGNGYFGTTAVSSAGTNASGIGIFEYDVPTGYTALCTKGLNE